MNTPVKIHTFRIVPPDADEAALDELIRLWKRSWKRNGWEPVVLTPEDCGIELESFTNAVSKLPTVNGKERELACYQRWMAMAHRGGWMADIDLFNYGFSPHHPLYEQVIRSARPGQIVSCDLHVPCLVYGSQSAFSLMAARFMCCGNGEKGYKTVEMHGRPHTSDMIILEGMDPSEYLAADLVREFNEEGWKEAKLVHYSCGRMRAFRPKGKWIPMIEKNRTK